GSGLIDLFPPPLRRALKARSASEDFWSSSLARRALTAGRQGRRPASRCRCLSHAAGARSPRRRPHPPRPPPVRPRRRPEAARLPLPLLEPRGGGAQPSPQAPPAPPPLDPTLPPAVDVQLPRHAVALRPVAQGRGEGLDVVRLLPLDELQRLPRLRKDVEL